MVSNFVNLLHHLQAQPLWILLLSSLGFLSLLTHFFFLINWLYIALLRRPKNLRNYGSWALITGATDGIGRAFAFQLARQGLNLVLVSRSYHKLRSVAVEIHARYPGTKIKEVASDLSSGGTAVEAAVEGLDVGVLVNNVGVTYPAARFFHEVEEEVWMKVVRVNLEATTRVTGAVLPGMVKRRRGAVVNIGSGAAVVVPSHPLFTIYAATKAYVDQFSRSLHVEYKDMGVDVQCQAPLYVSTKMASEVASIHVSSLFAPSPEKYAEAAVARIGFEARCSPYWAHSLQWFLASMLPECVLDSWRLAIGIRRRQSSLIGPSAGGDKATCNNF